MTSFFGKNLYWKDMYASLHSYPIEADVLDEKAQMINGSTGGQEITTLLPRSL